MPTQLTLSAQEGLTVKLALEPFAFELDLEPGWQYLLVAEEDAFTIEHASQQLTVCLDKELQASLYRRQGPALGTVESWQLINHFR